MGAKVEINSEVKRAVSSITIIGESQVSKYDFGYSLLAVFMQYFHQESRIVMLRRYLQVIQELLYLEISIRAKINGPT